MLFQLTSSQGGWPEEKLMIVFSVFFQLTSSQGGWPIALTSSILFFSFQLTSSQGGWRKELHRARAIQYFSTHILTRRMTKMITVKCIYLKLFNSHPHKEDDNSKFSCHITFLCFSTHILTRRMTVVVLDVGCRWTFQLTSSQGGWQFLLHHPKEQCLFNSHPHKEDDITSDIINSCDCFSTHILTRRMTGAPKGVFIVWVFSTHILTRRMTFCFTSICVSAYPFQLTSSQGGWLGSANCSFFAVLFQLTSSQGGWRSAGLS